MKGLCLRFVVFLVSGIADTDLLLPLTCNGVIHHILKTSRGKLDGGLSVFWNIKVTLRKLLLF